MPQPNDYFGLMGGAANIGGVNEAVQQSLLGGQQIQNNQNVLDQQRRADAARQAAAQIVSNPHIDDAQFEQLLQPIAQADPNAAVQMRRTRDIKNATHALMADPTPQRIGQFGMAYPEALKDWKASWEMMDAGQKDAALKASADVHGYLLAGDGDGAIKILQQHMDAASQTGEDVSAYPQLIQTIRENPKGALALSGLNLSLGMGHDKFADAYGKLDEAQRAGEMQPFKVRQEAAKASQEETTAQYAPAAAQSGLQTAEAQRQRMAAQNATDRVQAQVLQGRLALDQQALATNTGLKMAELDQNGAKLPEGSLKLVNDSAGASAEAQMLADREEDLAKKVDTSGMHGSIAATGAEFWKQVTGSQDGYTQIRAEWNQLRNQQALTGRKNMPGAMSDADRNFLLQGFPPANANPAYIARFLRVMAKAQRVTAAFEDTKASWVSQNSNLGPAVRDIVINGLRVPKGMTLPQYQAAAAKLQPKDLPPDAEAVVNRARQ